MCARGVATVPCLPAEYRLCSQLFLEGVREPVIAAEPAFHGPDIHVPEHLVGFPRIFGDVAAALGYAENTSWAGKNDWAGKIEGLYVNNPDQYQFWPIWQTFIDNSNGMLVNSSNYQ